MTKTDQSKRPEKPTFFSMDAFIWLYLAIFLAFAVGIGVTALAIGATAP